MKKTLKRPNYAEELLKIIQSPLKNEVLLDRLNDYHERDIADALELLSPQQRKKLYPVLGAERLAEIFSYLETPTQYLSELSINQAAKIVSFMDSDDAVDILEQMEASAKEKIVKKRKKSAFLRHPSDPLLRRGRDWKHDDYKLRSHTQRSEYPPGHAGTGDTGW